MRGYPEPPSVTPGESFLLRVSTEVPAFHVAIYRLGPSLEPVVTLGPWPGRAVPEGCVDEPWDWPAYRVAASPEWRSGIYLAVLLACQGPAPSGSGSPVEAANHDGCFPCEAPHIDSRDARLVFVVRRRQDRDPSPFLYKVALSTWHAYNATGGGSMYVGRSGDLATGHRSITTCRPGGGSGGDLSYPDAVDVYDPATPREGVAHWDAPFIAWLERSGYRADYCTDLDLHADPSLLEDHAAMLSIGHDEYWSAPTRKAVERFVASGGHAVIFSGNTCFWRIDVDADGRLLRCDHPPLADSGCDQWWQFDPEAALIGVSYVHAGGWWRGERDPLGYTVTDASHWVFAGTGLRNGDVFGAERRLIGYECDGAMLDQSGDCPPRPTGTGGTPRDFHVLGVARLGPGWQERPDGPSAAATMGVHVPGGVVFTAATTDWARVLAEGDPYVERITRNVLDALSVPGRRMHAPRQAQAGTEVLCWVDAGEGEEVQWEASVGTVTADGPLARLTLPDHPKPVTVSARLTQIAPRAVGDGPTMVGKDRLSGFATSVIDVLDPVDEAQVLLIEAVRRLVQATPPDPVPTLPNQPGNRPLSDPRWEARRDGLRRRLSSEEAAEVERRGGEIVAAATRLCQMLERDSPGAPEKN